jgi:hypothetical protein
MDIFNTWLGRTQSTHPTPSSVSPTTLEPPKLTRAPSRKTLEHKVPPINIAPSSSPTNTVNPVPNINEIQDEKSLEYFRGKNLNRDAFTYEMLMDIGWWPDKILLFLEILRLSYTNFITPYTSNGTVYDEAIRTATWYFHDPKYRDVPEIKQYRQIGNFEIHKDYLNKVIAEDNCYMYEIESRPRSSNEQKHYYLINALTKLLDMGQVIIKDKALSREDEHLVRIFCSVIQIKQGYNIVDDTLRNILWGALKGVKLSLDPSTFFSNLITEIDTRVMKKITKTMNEQFFNDANIFRDLLLYLLHELIMFSHIMGAKQTIDNKDAPIILMTPYSQYKFFTSDTIERLEYIYKLYVNQLIERNIRSKFALTAVTALTTSNYETYQKMMKDVDESVAALALVPPKYFKRGIFTEGEGFRAFTVSTSVDSPLLGSSKDTRDVRDTRDTRDASPRPGGTETQVSTIVEGLVSPSRKRAHSRRITYNGPTLTRPKSTVPLLTDAESPQQIQNPPPISPRS